MILSLPLRLLLWPLSLVYGAFVRIKSALYERAWLKRKRLKSAVISVGNLTTGGTGKTPLVIWLAEKFRADGKRVAILSRGYRGTGDTSDEIELMKSRLQNRVAFGVGKDRYAAGNQLEAREQINIFILDDGFQYQQLARDLNIVLIDASRPLRNEFLLPAGRMRESTSSLHRADVVVFTRVESQDAVKKTIHKFPEMPTFSSTTRLIECCRIETDGGIRPSSLEQITQPIFVFSGIGNPQAFLADVKRWGVKVVGQQEFRDHHRYDARDLQLLDAAAKGAGARGLLTTEKDAQNMKGAGSASLPIFFCKIALEIPDEQLFLSILQKKLATRPGAEA